MWCWEIDTRPPDSVLVASLWPREGVTGDWCAAWKNLKLPDPNKWMRLMGLPFGEARTTAAYHALQDGFQWLFFLDADVILPPDTVVRFINYRLPIVSALYPQRYPTFDGLKAVYKSCMFNEGKDEQGNSTLVEVGGFQYGQVLEVGFAPAGAMLIHRNVFTQMVAAGIKDFFEWTMKPTTNPHGRSEDFDFCMKARRLGYKIIVDTGVQAAHEVQAQVSVGTGLIPRV
jgi:hypothetical protein